MYWESMLAMRKNYEEIVVYGNFERTDEANEKAIAYERQSENGDGMPVLCTFSPDNVE